jgi:hypothetical protein
MREKRNEGPENRLPAAVVAFLRQATKSLRWRRKVRRDVQAELAAHFEDALRDSVTPEEKHRRVQALLAEFGDPRLLGALCRRAKKRCRPLWQKVLVRGAQALGVFVLYLVACSLPLFLGKPTVRVNYAEWLSTHWRPAQPGVENARRYYDRAVELYVEPPAALVARRQAPSWTVRDANEGDLQLLAGWLAENRPAFDLLRQGANTARYWPVYDVNDTNRQNVPFLWMQANVIPQTMEVIKGYRSLALAFRDGIAWQVRRGAIDEATDDSLLLVRFGRHLEGKGLLLDQMVGVAIEALGYNAMFKVLQRPDIGSERLARMQEKLASISSEDRCIINLDGEKVFWYDNIQRTFTDDGHGGGHALRYGLPFAAGDWETNLIRTLLFDYPDRREAVAMVDAYFEQAQEALRTPPHGKGQGSTQEDQTIAKQNLLLSVVAPAHERLVALAWRSRTHEAALVTTVAILRYRAEQGAYPADLGELVAAGVLARVPDDPFGEGPLVYRRTPEGFLLYSRGENGTDDGGRQGTGQNGQPRMWAGNGDWVFWPVNP